MNALHVGAQVRIVRTPLQLRYLYGREGVIHQRDPNEIDGCIWGVHVAGVGTVWAKPHCLEPITPAFDVSAESAQAEQPVHA